MKQIKYISTPLLAFTSLLTLFAPFSVTQADTLTWKQKSMLASGKWIKIEIPEQGITRIPYSQLREMGFTSPEKVGVYGRGGAMLPLSFTDLAGNQIFSDDISQTRCMHLDGALYFYAQGTDSYRFVREDSHDIPGYFSHQGKNIYSDNAFYFLSDAFEPLHVRTQSSTEKSPATDIQFIGHVHHELDLEQNIFNNGQIFWGESLSNPSEPYRENIAFPGLDKGREAVMDCGAYIEGRDKNATLGTLGFGISGGIGKHSAQVAYNSASNFQHVPGTRANVSIPSNIAEVFVEYEGFDDSHLCANLDYWSISYPLDPSRPMSANHPQVSFAAILAGSSQGAFHNADESLTAWDITDPSAPESLQRLQSGGGFLIPGAPETDRMIVLFRPADISSEICSWSEVPNQDIHTLASEGADFAIITLPDFKEQAIRLAELHETHYGQKCIVATTQELYNEFSGGTPDIMAYRGFVRMLHDSPNPVKNILLFGASRADARAIRSNGKQETAEYIIAFQTPNTTKRDGAMNDNDFIGAMCDIVADGLRFETLQVEVGVGALPCLSYAEAKTYVDKAERYMTGNGFADDMAHHLVIGCDGDSHQHEKQALKLQEEFRAFNDGHMFTTLFNDHIGNEMTHNRILSSINSGVGVVSYIGHGGPLTLTQKKGVFEYSDISHMRNLRTPFMYFSACNITNSDMGHRGLSEEMVLGTRYGLIGTVTSSRTAWSGPNYDLMMAFYSNLYRKDSSDQAPMPATVGEAYARAKSGLSSSNELSFQLLCDPALVIPVPLRSMSDPEVNGKAGQKVEFTGIVTDSEGERDRDFNGSLSVRILAPAVTENVAGTITGEPGPEVTYLSEVIAIGAGTVEDGKYTGQIMLPAHMANLDTDEFTIQLTSYDPSRHVTAASSHKLSMTGQDTSLLSSDCTPPWISDFRYDDASGELSVETTDDMAIDLSNSFLTNGFILFVDGIDIPASQCDNITVGADIASCRRQIPLGHLSEGSHSAYITIKDAAGNRHEEEFRFVVGESFSTYLTADCRNAEGKVVFSLSGKPNRGDISIYDMEGVHIMDIDASNAIVELNAERLPAGRYRAVFSSDDGTIRTNTVTLTLI